jgi:hypothetical protein
MTLKNLRVLAAFACVLWGCPGSSESARSDDAGGAGPDGGLVDPRDLPCDYEQQTVELTENLVIAAGDTVHVCPGVTFRAATDVQITVLGALFADGTSEAPVRFLGTAEEPRSWHGLVIESGGDLKLSHAKIGGAIYGTYAMPGSSFDVDASELGTSFKVANVQADGTFTNTKFRASAPPNVAITDAVSVDDPNGTVTIMDASPSFSNCRFDGISAYTDLVRVGGESSPTFDRVYLHAAHCGFHTFGGTNTSIHVTNAIFEKLAYGVMAYTTKPIIEDSVFIKNLNDVGICTGATEDNTPVLENNHYEKGEPTIDASCFRIGTTDPSPAATANPGAGTTIP